MIKIFNLLISAIKGFGECPENVLDTKIQGLTERDCSIGNSLL